MERATVAVGGGRVLSYREFGRPDGRPVVYCHGGLVSGLDAAPWDAAASEAGVRIVSPARPGLDGSSPAPGRTTADWADDVCALLDSLDIEQAAMLGWSMGGQYALACAALLPERMTRAVVVASALPLTDEATLDQLNKLDRRLTRESHDRPWVARATFATMAQVALRAPALWTKTATRGLPDTEAKVVRELSDAGLARATAAGVSCTHGMVEEYLAWARPWGFEPSEIRVPVVVWQGTSDDLIPQAWGEALAQQIPNARFSLQQDAGHFVAFAHMREVLGDLIGAST